MKCVEINIFGRVQGVGFRYFVKDKAIALNLTGYVKNQYDGSVKVVAQGEAEKIKNLIEFCKIGTSYSRVQNVEYHEVTCIEKRNFEIKI